MPSQKREQKLRRNLQAASYTTGGQSSDKLYSTLDRNHDGTVSFDEFTRAVRATGKLTEADMPEKAMRKIFNRLDTDSDGMLSQAELEQFVWQDQAQPAGSSPEAEPAADLRIEPEDYDVAEAPLSPAGDASVQATLAEKDAEIARLRQQLSAGPSAEDFETVEQMLAHEVRAQKRQHKELSKAQAQCDSLQTELAAKEVEVADLAQRLTPAKAAKVIGAANAFAQGSPSFQSTQKESELRLQLARMDQQLQREKSANKAYKSREKKAMRAREEESAIVADAQQAVSNARDGQAAAERERDKLQRLLATSKKNSKQQQQENADLRRQIQDLNTRLASANDSKRSADEKLVTQKRKTQTEKRKVQELEASLQDLAEVRSEAEQPKEAPETEEAPRTPRKTTKKASPAQSRGSPGSNREPASPRDSTKNWGTGRDDKYPQQAPEPEPQASSEDSSDHEQPGPELEPAPEPEISEGVPQSRTARSHGYTRVEVEILPAKAGSRSRRRGSDDGKRLDKTQVVAKLDAKLSAREIKTLGGQPLVTKRGLEVIDGASKGALWLEGPPEDKFDKFTFRRDLSKALGIPVERIHVPDQPGSVSWQGTANEPLPSLRSAVSSILAERKVVAAFRHKDPTSEGRLNSVEAKAAAQQLFPTTRPVLDSAYDATTKGQDGRVDQEGFSEMVKHAEYFHRESHKCLEVDQMEAFDLDAAGEIMGVDTQAMEPGTQKQEFFQQCAKQSALTKDSQAEGAYDQRANIAGLWKASFTGSSTTAQEQFVLYQDRDGRVTGIDVPSNQIDDPADNFTMSGSMSGSSFELTQEFDGENTVWNGTVDVDEVSATLSGTWRSTRGESESGDFTAVHVKSPVAMIMELQSMRGEEVYFYSDDVKKEDLVQEIESICATHLQADQTGELAETVKGLTLKAEDSRGRSANRVMVTLGFSPPSLDAARRFDAIIAMLEEELNDPEGQSIEVTAAGVRLQSAFTSEKPPVNSRRLQALGESNPGSSLAVALADEGSEGSEGERPRSRGLACCIAEPPDVSAIPGDEHSFDVGPSMQNSVRDDGVVDTLLAGGEPGGAPWGTYRQVPPAPGDADTSSRVRQPDREESELDTTVHRDHTISISELDATAESRDHRVGHRERTDARQAAAARRQQDRCYALKVEGHSSLGEKYEQLLRDLKDENADESLESIQFKLRAAWIKTSFPAGAKDHRNGPGRTPETVGQPELAEEYFHKYEARSIDDRCWEVDADDEWFTDSKNRVHTNGEIVRYDRGSFNGLYRAGDEDFGDMAGWPVYRNEFGRYLYRTADQTRWVFSAKYDPAPESGKARGVASTRHGDGAVPIRAHRWNSKPPPRTGASGSKDDRKTVPLTITELHTKPALEQNPLRWTKDKFLPPIVEANARCILAFDPKHTAKGSFSDDERTAYLTASAQLADALSREFPYFEVEILSEGQNPELSVGVAYSLKNSPDSALETHAGWDEGSVGFHADTGKLCAHKAGAQEGQEVWKKPLEAGDKIQCGLVFDDQTGEPEVDSGRHNIWFAINGTEVAQREKIHGYPSGYSPVHGSDPPKAYPLICMTGGGKVKVNMGVTRQHVAVGLRYDPVIDTVPIKTKHTEAHGTPRPFPHRLPPSRLLTQHCLRPRVDLADGFSLASHRPFREIRLRAEPGI